MKGLVEKIPTVILASASRGRKQILEKLGINVICKPTDCDENISICNPAELVKELAKRKMEAFEQKYGKTDLPVISADTIVYYNKMIIGKAHSRDDAYRQLKAFSGNKHQVYSGCAINFKNAITIFYDVADVTFSKIDDEIINNYLDSGVWEGAAGSYRLQEGASNFILEINGDKNTIIGLPLNQISDIISNG